MASPLVFKIYNPTDGMYAATRYAEDAAAMVSVAGEGGYVRYGSIKVWREGAGFDGFAGESYDAAASLMRDRIRTYNARKHAQAYRRAA